METQQVLCTFYNVALVVVLLCVKKERRSPFLSVGHVSRFSVDRSDSLSEGFSLPARARYRGHRWSRDLSERVEKAGKPLMIRGSLRGVSFRLTPK